VSDVDIHVEGWTRPPADAELGNLAGAIVQVLVGGIATQKGTPWGEFLRFARVIKAEAKPAGTTTVCARFETAARWQISVECETDYTSPDGDILCEHSITGVVRSGAESINF